MADWGVFAVARDIWDHPVLTSDSEPFSKREAWMWLVSAAAWKPIKIGWRGSVVDLKRGEFCFALTFLAKRWRWAKTNVSRFLARLKTADMITLQNRTDERDDTCVYSINNYNKFQVVGLPKRTDVGTESGPIPDRHRTQEETFKHSNIQTEKKKEVVAPVALPAWMPLETWDSFLGTRKKVTAHASKLLVSQLEKLKEGGDDPKEVLEQSIMNGWKGLFPLKRLNANGSGLRKPTATDQHLAGIASLVEDIRERRNTRQG